MSLVSNKKTDNNLVELEIKVDAEAFEAALQRAYKKNVGKIQVPGFRKGKAPRKIIEKMYGKECFYEDAVNDIYPIEYAAAVKEAGIDPVDHPDVEVVSLDENGLVFKAKVVVKPEVEVTNYKGIEVKKTIAAVTEEEINSEIDRLRDRNGRLVNVDDRAAANGDNTVIDFEGFVDGVAFEGGKGENYPLTLGSNQFIPGFEDQIVGHKVGEEFDVNVPFPAEYHVPELAGKDSVFKVKLNEIRVRELPEADDEFAKDVSEFDTLDELKADIKAKLTETKEKAADTDVENKLIDTVIDNMKADIPAVMFDHAVDNMVHDFEHRLASQGMTLELYLQYTGFDMDSFKKQFEDQAQKQVKIRLALEKIVELENIAPTEEELNAEFENMAKTYSMDVEKVKELVPVEELSADIAVQKAIDLVKESAVIKTTRSRAKKATTEASEDAPTTKKTTSTAKKTTSSTAKKTTSTTKKTTTAKKAKTETAE